VCLRVDCGRRIVEEDEVSRAVFPDGTPLSLPAFDTNKPHAFELTCPAGHAVTVHFPRDVMIVKSPDVSGGGASIPAVLRP
jgi:hypothetical protein